MAKETLDVKKLINSFQSLNSILSAFSETIDFDNSKFDIASKKLKDAAVSFSSGEESAGVVDSIKSIFGVYQEIMSNSTTDTSNIRDISSLVQNGISDIYSFVSDVKESIETLPALYRQSNEEDLKKYLMERIEFAKSAQVGEFGTYRTKREQKAAVANLEVRLRSAEQYDSGKRSSVDDITRDISAIASSLLEIDRSVKPLLAIDMQSVSDNLEGKDFSKSITRIYISIETVYDALNNVDTSKFSKDKVYELSDCIKPITDLIHSVESVSFDRSSSEKIRFMVDEMIDILDTFNKKSKKTRNALDEISYISTFSGTVLDVVSVSETILDIAERLGIDDDKVEKVRKLVLLYINPIVEIGQHSKEIRRGNRLLVVSAVYLLISANILARLGLFVIKRLPSFYSVLVMIGVLYAISKSILSIGDSVLKSIVGMVILNMLIRQLTKTYIRLRKLGNLSIGLIGTVPSILVVLGYVKLISMMVLSFYGKGIKMRFSLNVISILIGKPGMGIFGIKRRKDPPGLIQIVDRMIILSKKILKIFPGTYEKLMVMGMSLLMISKVFSSIGKSAGSISVGMLTSNMLAKKLSTLIIDIKLSQKMARGITMKTVTDIGVIVLIISIIGKMFVILGNSFVRSLLGIKTAGILMTEMSNIILKLKLISNQIKTMRLRQLQMEMWRLIAVVAQMSLFMTSIIFVGLAVPFALISLAGFSIVVSMALLVLLTVSKITGRRKINKNGIPDSCKPLLAIAGSFIMFSMSVLLLGLTNDLTLESLGGFVAIVVMAIGVLFLINRVKGQAMKGALTLMVVAGAFLLFSAVLVVISNAAERADFVQMIGMVGIIAALIAVAAVAGFAIVPLLLGSLGLIALGLALMVFSVSLMMLIGITKMIGDDTDDAMTPVMDCIDVIVSRMSKISIVDMAVAATNAFMTIFLMVALIGVVITIRVLRFLSPKPEDTEKLSLSMRGVTSSIKVITDGLSTINILDLTKSMAIAFEAMMMLVPLSIVALILLGFSRMRIATEFDKDNKPIAWESLNGSSFDRIGGIMTSLAKSISDTVDALSTIGIGDMTKGLAISVEALLMMVPLSIVALILLGFSRMRIATEFDKDNKPIAWESLDGSSFDRVGDTMSNMVGALNKVVTELNKMGIVEMGKAVVKSVEALAMMAAVSGIMGILVKIGSKRIPVEWDKDNKPTRYENFDNSLISKSVETSVLLVKAIDGIAGALGKYDTNSLKTAKKNAKLMRKILKPISSMMDIVIKLTTGPLNYGPCDEDGNPTGNGDTVIKGNLGEYLSSHKKQISDNIDTLISIFDMIANKITGPEGIGEKNTKDIKSAKKNMGRIAKILNSLMPAIDLIQSMSSGQFNVGTEEKPEMVNLGQFISTKRGLVEKNVDDLFGFINFIGEKAESMNEGPSNRDIKKANRKMGKIGDIIESLNTPLDLIMKMSDGEFEIKDEQGNLIEKMNLGKYIATKSKDVESNLDTLITFIGHIGDRINTELNGENNPSKQDLKKAEKKTGLIGDVLNTMSSTLEIIEKMASGQIQVGTNENGEPVMKSLSEFLNDSADGITKNMDLLIDFIVGPDGIQSHLDKITGEKGGTAEKKQNTINTVKSFAETIDSILDLTIKMGNAIEDPKTKDLFGGEGDNSLRSRMEQIMQGYSVPLDDNTVFADSGKFKVRFKNLSNYDKLMKSIMDVKNVEYYERSVKATGDMVQSINSINDSKIDKLNTLMVNMTKFGETMDEALKEVFDKVVELAEELHYIIEDNEKKNGSGESKSKSKESGSSGVPGTSGSKQNIQGIGGSKQNNQGGKQQSPDMSSIEDYLALIKTAVQEINKKVEKR